MYDKDFRLDTGRQDFRTFGQRVRDVSDSIYNFYRTGGTVSRWTKGLVTAAAAFQAGAMIFGVPGSTTPPYQIKDSHGHATVYPESNQVLLRLKDKSAVLADFNKSQFCKGFTEIKAGARISSNPGSIRPTYEVASWNVCESFNKSNEATTNLLAGYLKEGHVRYQKRYGSLPKPIPE